MTREAKPQLAWQSKAILLIVVPWSVLDVLFQSYFWAQNAPVVAWTTLAISAAFSLIVWRMKAGTAAAAATGAVITASLMYSTASYPYATSWLHGGLSPLLAVFLLTFAATRIGRAKKERLGTGESKRGRNAAQVAANLGVAALAAQSALKWPAFFGAGDQTFFAVLLALSALAEAAADTVSSEIGQVFGGQPRMITNLRLVESGVDGGVTAGGTLAGALAACIVALVGVLCLFADRTLLGRGVLTVVVALAGTLGLLFDSVLGATCERAGWLNNDAVNFLSTLSAIAFAYMALLALVSMVRL